MHAVCRLLTDYHDTNQPVGKLRFYVVDDFLIAPLRIVFIGDDRKVLSEYIQRFPIYKYLQKFTNIPTVELLREDISLNNLLTEGKNGLHSFLFVKTEVVSVASEPASRLTIHLLCRKGEESCWSALRQFVQLGQDDILRLLCSLGITALLLRKDVYGNTLLYYCRKSSTAQILCKSLSGDNKRNFLYSRNHCNQVAAWYMVPPLNQNVNLTDLEMYYVIKTMIVLLLICNEDEADFSINWHTTNELVSRLRPPLEISAEREVLNVVKMTMLNHDTTSQSTWFTHLVKCGDVHLFEEIVDWFRHCNCVEELNNLLINHNSQQTFFHLVNMSPFATDFIERLIGVVNPAKFLNDSIVDSVNNKSALDYFCERLQLGFIARNVYKCPPWLRRASSCLMYWTRREASKIVDQFEDILGSTKWTLTTEQRNVVYTRLLQNKPKSQYFLQHAAKISYMARNIYHPTKLYVCEELFQYHMVRIIIIMLVCSNLIGN